jgi:hypothetical protein
MSDYWNDDVESEDTEDLADYESSEDDMSEWSEEPEAVPTLPEPAEPLPEEIIPGSVVVAPPEPSFEEQLLAVARPAAPSAASASAEGITADQLTQIALNDPEEYLRLKEQGHALNKLSWGPSRRG